MRRLAGPRRLTRQERITMKGKHMDSKKDGHKKDIGGKGKKRV
jgi:hypothetical protein